MVGSELNIGSGAIVAFVCQINGVVFVAFDQVVILGGEREGQARFSGAIAIEG